MHGRDPFTRRAWRMAAIYRCCVRYGKDKSWAYEKVREVCPDGYRDHMVENWFTDIESVITRVRRDAEYETPRLIMEGTDNVMPFAA